MQTVLKVTTILSNISQLLLFGLACIGYVYTVLPIYQKEVLAEEVAKLEQERKKLTSETENLSLKINEQNISINIQNGIIARSKYEMNSQHDEIILKDKRLGKLNKDVARKQKELDDSNKRLETTAMGILLNNINDLANMIYSNNVITINSQHAIFDNISDINEYINKFITPYDAIYKAIQKNIDNNDHKILDRLKSNLLNNLILFLKKNAELKHHRVDTKILLSLIDEKNIAHQKLQHIEKTSDDFFLKIHEVLSYDSTIKKEITDIIIQESNLIDSFFYNFKNNYLELKN